MPDKTDGRKDREGPTTSSLTTLGPNLDTSQANATSQKRCEVPWAEVDQSCDGHQTERAPNQNGGRNYPMNGADMECHAIRMNSAERKQKRDRMISYVRERRQQQQLNAAHKCCENGAARNKAPVDLPNVAERRNGSIGRGLDEISLEELGESSTPQTCRPSASMDHQNREIEMVWKSKSDYITVVMTYVIGIGNVIRFPQLCYKHGGGAFFVPYFVMLVLEGIPLVCLEMAVGQRFGRNSFMNVWKDLSPSLRGIGLAAVIETLLCVLYYNFYVSWGLYYFIHSMRRTLPWKDCPRVEDTTDTNGTSLKLDPECVKSGPAKYYFYRQTLGIADDINHSEGINMYLYLFVFIAWLVSFLVVMKGIRKTPKPLKICLGLILLILATFFFVGVHLDGWAEGLALLFIPKWDKLLDPVVWMDAAGQIFYTLGIGFGSLSLFATGNKPTNSFYEDALVCALGNGMASMWASIIIFSFFGFTLNYKMKQCENATLSLSAFNHSVNTSNIFPTMKCNRSDILDQIPTGIALPFVGLSEAFDNMDYSTLLSCLFFLLLFLLGATSMLGMIDILVRTGREMGMFPKTWRNELVSGLICLTLCATNLLFVQSTGVYLVEIMSSASSLPLLFTGLAECIAVSYVYGMNRFCKDLRLMSGKPPKMRWKLCWTFISPLIILGVIVGGITQMIKAGQFTYTAWDRDKAEVIYRPYPPWAYVLYALFAGVPTLCIIYPPLVRCLFKCKQQQVQDVEEEQLARCHSCANLREVCKRCTTMRSKTYHLPKVADNTFAATSGHVNDAMSN